MALSLLGWKAQSPLVEGTKSAKLGSNMERASTVYHSRVRPPASMPSSPWNCTVSRPFISLALRMCSCW